MRLVILDRDGTINEDRENYVKSPGEWVPIPGALEAIARINHAGWHVVVATNQSGIGRGLFDADTLSAIHLKMIRMLATHGGRIDAVFFCPHRPDDGCDCRKPAPGLFRKILERYGAAPASVHAAGDSARDAEAAKAAGCVAHLVRTGKAESMAGVAVHADLGAFADWITSPERRPRT